MLRDSMGVRGPEPSALRAWLALRPSLILPARLADRCAIPHGGDIRFGPTAIGKRTIAFPPIFPIALSHKPEHSRAEEDHALRDNSRYSHVRATLVPRGGLVWPEATF